MKSICERIRELEIARSSKGPRGRAKSDFAVEILCRLKKDLLAEVRRLDKDIQKTEFMGKALLKAQISRLKEVIGDDESGGGKGKTGSEMDVVHGHDASVDVVVKASLHNPVREGSNPSTVPNCRSVDLDAIKKKWATKQRNEHRTASWIKFTGTDLDEMFAEIAELLAGKDKEIAELKKENERLIEEMNYQAGCYIEDGE